MIELLLSLLPVLLVDVLNPVLFAMLVFAAGSSKPVANSLSMLAGHTVAYFAAGVVVSFGIEQLTARLAAPQSIDFVISGLVGIGLIWAALATKKGGAPDADEPEWEMTPAACFGFGAVLNFIGIPFALPYFAAVDQILKANLTTGESLFALGVYNALYALPFLSVPVATAISGESSRAFLQRVNQFLERAADLLMPWLFLLLGLTLLADSVAFFMTGEGLIEFGT